MQAVGKIGSYIGRSVHTVSGPFHPFGGAVDIIVVQQPDGSYKSSPWYIRFGKFQGVLKTKEKVVSILVNGAEADFHMYLDHKGEAFFLKEVELEESELACSPSSTSDDFILSDSVGNRRSGIDTLTRTNSRRSQILGLVFGKKSRKEEVMDGEEAASNFVRTESLERAEIAADLLELKWSTNLTSSRLQEMSTSRVSAVDVTKNEVNRGVLDDDCGYDEKRNVSDRSPKELDNSVEEKRVNMNGLNSDYIVDTGTSVESTKKDTDLSNSEEAVTDKFGCLEPDFHVNSMSIVSGASATSFPDEVSPKDAFKSFPSEATENPGVGYVQSSEQKTNSCHGGYGETFVHTETVENITLKSESRKETMDEQEPIDFREHFSTGDQLRVVHEEKVSMTGGNMYGTSPLVSFQSNDSVEAMNSHRVITTSASSCSTCSPVDEETVLPSIQTSVLSREEHFLRRALNGFHLTEAKHLEFSCSNHEDKEIDSSFTSTVDNGADKSYEAICCSVLPLDQSLIDDYMNESNPSRRSKSTCNDFSDKGMGHVRPKEFKRMVKSLPSKESFRDNNGAPQTVAEQVKILQQSSKGMSNVSHGNSLRSVDSLRGIRRGFPFSFKRTRSLRLSFKDPTGNGNPCLNNSIELEEGKDTAGAKVNKKISRTIIPTSEQLASLNLKEGKNTVIFTFSTAMLGKQQVDARIFLWRWDTRIVISDVDGTITRSDLLGQVMPWVGLDWSQSGVAHLFTAIKENGYQLLFLSARAISQSFHTRQFLSNIRQNGKALPDGPVVISPDGLFPSLFREVVRRAPHEFKIGCLEDIKSLFPADVNPFYAGFGNRDTDEVSYLKVGIPRGKIFTINPKGEIVVNRHVHPKSYLSMHGLVHGMFPTMSCSEQEDYNSWNYWKLPAPVMDA